jgi:hypothetical protein
MNLIGGPLLNSKPSSCKDPRIVRILRKYVEPDLLAAIPPDILKSPTFPYREVRWMMHALKYRWPIDNIDRLRGGEDGLSGKRQQARLTEAVQSFEPLTAPYEIVGRLLHGNFMNTTDADIVHWLVERLGISVMPLTTSRE